MASKKRPKQRSSAKASKKPQAPTAKEMAETIERENEPGMDWRPTGKVGEPGEPIGESP